MERFVKPKESTIFRYPVYLMDGPGPSIAVLGPHEEFFNSAFWICICGKHSSHGFFRPITMHEVWRALGLRQLRLEQLSSLWKEVAMIRARVMLRKHVISAFMLALKEAEIKAEDIPVQMH